MVQYGALDGGCNEKNWKNSCALHPWGFTCLLLWRVPGGTSADRYKCPGVHYVDR